MTTPVTTGAAGAQYQAQINALKSMATIVQVEEETFRTLLRSRPHPTIVAGVVGAWWWRKHAYLTSYDGFVFYLSSEKPLEFKEDCPGAFYVDAAKLQLPFFS